MRDMFQTVWLFVRAVRLAARGAGHSAAEMAERYFSGLAVLTNIAMVIPWLLAVIGCILEWRPLIALMGVWCGIFSEVLFIWGIPIGIVASAAMGEPVGAPADKKDRALKWLGGKARKYMHWARGILFWELVSFFLFSCFPPENHWLVIGSLPTIVLGIMIVSRSEEYEPVWLKPSVGWIVGGIVAFTILTCFYPSLRDTIVLLGYGVRREFRHVFDPYSNLILGSVILVVVLFLLARRFGFGLLSGGSKTAEGTASPVKKFGLARTMGIVGIVLLVLLAIGLWNGSIQRFIRREIGRAQAAPVAEGATLPSGAREIELVAYPGTNYTSFYVGHGTNMWWSIVRPYDAHIMYHMSDGDSRDEEDSNDTRTTVPAGGGYTAYVRPKGVDPVVLLVHLTPLGR